MPSPEIAAFLLASLFATPAVTNVQVVAAQLEAARHTRDTIEQKLEAREHDLKVRIRALYKLTAFGELPLWVDNGARDDFLHRRASGSRMLMRDLEERLLLRTELVAAESDVARLSTATEQALAAVTPPPTAGSLGRPLNVAVAAPFGIYVDETTHARINRHGIELAPATGPVMAVGDGKVLYAGPIRGLGTGVIMDHGRGLVSITGNLATILVTRGDELTRGTTVGTVANDRVYLETRVAARPVDPAPLLRALR